MPYLHFVCEVEDHASAIDVLDAVRGLGVEGLKFAIDDEDDELTVSKKKTPREIREKQGAGPKKSWEEAEAYAKKHKLYKENGDLDLQQARIILAKEKRKKKAEAVLKAGSKRR